VPGEWPAFFREFGLPIGMLIAFAGMIGAGILVAGKSVEQERKTVAEERTRSDATWTARLAEWKDRTAAEHERAVTAETRLGDAIPVIASATEQLRLARQDLADDRPRR